MSAQDENRYRDGVLVKYVPNDNCPSCNTPWVNHLGIQGVCRELQEYKTSHARLVVALEAWDNADRVALIDGPVVARQFFNDAYTEGRKAITEAKKLTGDTK